MIYFEVKNQGPAISAASSAHIFEPLVSGTTQPNADGSSRFGLGLYIVSEVVKAHGGHVQVRSVADETVFAVEIPRNRGSASITPSPVPPL